MVESTANVAFGVRLFDLPDIPFSLGAATHRGSALRWFHSYGSVAGEWFWKRAHGSGLSIGWSGYASYEISVEAPTRSVTATLEVDLTEGAIAFVVSVLPLILPCWGLEPLHGSAVLAGDGAMVVLGPSGAGKSSLAAALERRGFPFITDDASAFDDGLLLWPGPPVVNPRWTEAQQPSVGEYNEKRMRIPSRYSAEPVPAAAVIVLEPGSHASLKVSEPKSEARLQAILANARHGGFLRKRRLPLQFKVATGLAQLPLVTVGLDPMRHGPEDVLEALESWSDRIGIPLADRGPALDRWGR